MVTAARGGDVRQAVICRLALRGIARPTLEQEAGATLEVLAMSDLHLIARAHTEDG